MQKTLTEMEKEYIRLQRKDFFFCFAIFAAVTVIAFFFTQRASDPTLNIAMLYTLGIVAPTVRCSCSVRWRISAV